MSRAGRGFCAIELGVRHVLQELQNWSEVGPGCNSQFENCTSGPYSLIKPKNEYSTRLHLLLQCLLCMHMFVDIFSKKIKSVLLAITAPHLR